MRTILKIGYQDYLLPKGARPEQVVKALTGAVRLDSKHIEGTEYFWPEKGAVVSVETVYEHQLCPCDPDKARPAVPVEPKRINGHHPRRALPANALQLQLPERT